MIDTESHQSLFCRMSTRRQNQVMSVEPSDKQDLEKFELFQSHVSQRFSSLLWSKHYPLNQVGSINTLSVAATTPVEPLLSIAWLRRLFDIFLCCEAEFKSFIVLNRASHQIYSPPLDRLISEYLERSVRFLDICNAVSLGLDAVQQCQRFAEIVVSSLSSSPARDGQMRRARKALASLRLALREDEREHGSSRFSSPEGSFGRKLRASTYVVASHLPLRSLSPVAKNWSAASKVQAMGANLTATRGGTEATTIRAAVYMMSVVMVFTAWTIAAALPCQDRSGLAGCFQVPRHAEWSGGIVALHERIGGWWKRKGRSKCGGLLEEMQRLEKLGDGLMEICEGSGDPSDVGGMVGKMGDVCRRLEEGLGPLQLHIREIFHRVVRSREEILELCDPHCA